MGTPFEVVIVGAGVQGASTAYHLAVNGVTNVLVLESLARPGMGSSGRSGSMLMKSRENATKIEFSNYSYDWLMQFDTHFNEPLSFRRTGFLSLVSPELSARYKREHELRVQLGVPSEILSPKEIERVAPAIHADGIEFGILCPDDGVIEPSQLIHSYLREAQRLGVTVRCGEPVMRLLLSGDRVVGVQTRSDSFQSQLVVNAAGAAAKWLAGSIGLDLPITNLRRSLYFVESSAPELQTGPMVEEASLEWYYRGLGNGRVLVGMGLEDDDLVGDEADLSFWSTVQEVASYRAPALGSAVVTGGTSGLRSLTPDLLPIVGLEPTRPGYVHNCGWGGEGIMHSPAGGRMTADSIIGASTAGLDLQACASGRFGTITKS